MIYKSGMNGIWTHDLCDKLSLDVGLNFKKLLLVIQKINLAVELSLDVGLNFKLKINMWTNSNKMYIKCWPVQ